MFEIAEPNFLPLRSLTRLTVAFSGFGVLSATLFPFVLSIGTDFAGTGSGVMSFAKLLPRDIATDGAGSGVGAREISATTVLSGTS